jgi:hypothetical protein
MVKASKLESYSLKERGSATFLIPGQSQSEEKKRLQPRHLDFDIVNSLGWEQLEKGIHFIFPDVI